MSYLVVRSTICSSFSISLREFISKHITLLKLLGFMMSAGTDLNQKIISVNLDMMEEQRLHMHQALDGYVDKVVSAGRQWTRSLERNQPTFLQIHKIISKAVEFLSWKYDEIEREHLSCLWRETPGLTEKEELTYQHKHVPVGSSVDKCCDFSMATPTASHGESTEGDNDCNLNTHTCRGLNLESDRQTRSEDLYNKLQNVLAKQDGLDLQINMKIHDLREEIESLKSHVDQIDMDLSAKVDKINTGLSGKIDEFNRDLSDRISENKTELSDKVEETSTELSDRISAISSELTDISDKVDKINTGLSGKIDEFNRDLSDRISENKTELSDKVDDIDTDLSAKVDEFKTDMSAKFDKISTDLSGKIDDLSVKISDTHLELSDKVDKINTDLTDKIDKVKTEISDTVDEINTDLSANAEAISAASLTLSDHEQEHATLMNKIVDLENHFNTTEKDMQNNVKKVEQQLDELGTNYVMIRELFINRLGPLEKLRDILNDRASNQNENARQLQAVVTELKDLSKVVETCTKKSEVRVVGFKAEATFQLRRANRKNLCDFESPTFISGCLFDSSAGRFTASMDGIYLAYINLRSKRNVNSVIYLMHRDASRDHTEQICLASSQIEDFFNVDMVEMKVDDELFIQIDLDFTCRLEQINSPVVQFSCLKIG